MTNKQTIEALKKQAGAAIDAHAGDLRQISLDLHDHPEIGWSEKYAARRLSDYLESQRFTLERGIGGLDTAFRATYDSGKPGPTVAILAEFDALPDVGHGCGHNLIAAGALGAGLGVQSVLEQVGGVVLVLGTPAEEFTNQLQGKIQLLRAGEFAGIDACLMFHPWPVSAPINSSLAFVSMDIVFHGQTSHAAADPVERAQRAGWCDHDLQPHQRAAAARAAGCAHPWHRHRWWRGAQHHP